MLDLFQKHLDAISAALMAGDFYAYMRLVTVPLVVVTDKATAVISDEQEYRYGFDNYAGMLRTERATDLVRLASAVSELAPNLITGRYETHILRTGQRIYGPFKSALSMRCEDDIWKVCSVVNPAHADKWPLSGMHKTDTEKSEEK